MAKIKGEKHGLCNRKACQSPENVVWYNHSTHKYYCHNYAIMINEANEFDAQEMFGHDLCTLEVHPV